MSPPPPAAFLLPAPLPAQVTSLCPSEPSSAAAAALAVSMVRDMAWRIRSTRRPASGESRSSACSCVARSRPLRMSSITCAYGAAAAAMATSNLTREDHAARSRTPKSQHTLLLLFSSLLRSGSNPTPASSREEAQRGGRGIYGCGTDWGGASCSLVGLGGIKAPIALAFTTYRGSGRPVPVRVSTVLGILARALQLTSRAARGGCPGV